eukprot:TRINITY_DN6805_c0_g1_i8.p1 TRINITY_DN6805_c0_g1~~TRINITY_DN6805_c0_g1_i8.p1  ORF type:complete len:216 (+),score=32.39 TRINITY_DN6805_c0_g1_i8:1-648(+)
MNSLSTWANSNTSLTNPCNWVGITCTQTSPPSVISLSLQGLNLSGDISPSICKLPNLSHLNLANNLFNQSIPLHLSQCTALQTLNLSSNLIWGTLPDQISKLGSLKVLDLSSNYLEGKIPQSLSSLSSLQVLNLGKNRFSDFITAISATLFNNLWPDSNISSLAYLSSSPKAAALSSTLVQCCLIHLWELPRHLPHPLDLSQRYCILFSISYIYF